MRPKYAIMQGMSFSPIGMVFAATAITWSAYALPATQPVLPPVEHADTETVTNVPFAAWGQRRGEFKFTLEFLGTVSNGVEMAFGVDADGDGELSDGEVELLAGWDCGALFIADNAMEERAMEAVVDGAHVFSCICEMRSGGRIASVACTDNGSAVFPDPVAAKSAWLHASAWNMVRLAGRGENVRTGEYFLVQTTPSGFLFRFR